MNFFEKPQETKCKTCNAIILEDGTAVGCAGECDREAATQDDYRPLNFNDDEVVRELPEMWPGMNGDDDYEDDIDGLDVDAGVVDHE